MFVTLMDVNKRRNNVVSNLSLGVRDGLRSLGIEHRISVYRDDLRTGDRNVDVSTVDPRTTHVILPYWISNGIWKMNIASIKLAYPSARIISYTGTSPFWNGSVPCYRPANRSISTEGMPVGQAMNYEAIDLFAVVKARDGVSPFCQREVGVGIQPEIRVGPKARTPVVVLDFMKEGWDERSYDASVSFLSNLAQRIPDLRTYVLGSNAMTRGAMGINGASFVPSDHVPFQDLATIWSSAWAFICHNESFGYPVMENLLSGTAVFSSPGAEVPSWHREWVGPIDMLEDHIDTAKNEGIDKMAKELAARYNEGTGWIRPWHHVVEDMLA